jgi:hypothetical protein
MKYTVELELDLPRDRVIELFDNRENMFKCLKYMQYFKAFAEEGKNVNEPSQS